MGNDLIFATYLAVKWQIVQSKQTSGWFPSIYPHGVEAGRWWVQPAMWKSVNFNFSAQWKKQNRSGRHLRAKLILLWPLEISLGDDKISNFLIVQCVYNVKFSHWAVISYSLGRNTYSAISRHGGKMCPC